MASGLRVYRELLRSASTAFRGDTDMLVAAQREIRQQFEQNKDVSDPTQITELLAAGNETAEFIATSIVQAKVNDRGHYEVALEDRHADADLEPVVPGMKLPKADKN